jgi:hypothetical protein
VVDFNTPLSAMDKSSRPLSLQKKSRKFTLELINTIGQINLTDIYRIFHPAAV